MLWIDQFMDVKNNKNINDYDIGIALNISGLFLYCEH